MKISNVLYTMYILVIGDATKFVPVTTATFHKNG